MQFVVNPLFKAWDRFLDTDLTKIMLNNLVDNQAKWKAIMEATDDDSEGSGSGGNESIKDKKNDEKEAVDSIQDLPIIDVLMEAESNSNSISFVGEKIHDNEVDMEVVQKVRYMYENRLKEEKMSEPEGEEEEDEDEEEEDKNDEEDDIVGHDVNLMYHYQTDSSEHLGDAGGRCLSPVNEDMEHIYGSSGNGRRFSMPHMVRKDLNFYLGLRREGNVLRNPFSRRQSLPVTAMRFQSVNVNTSDNLSVPADSKSPRSVSMDTLLSRPKISNLSPNMDASFINSCIDPHMFTPLENQTLMLQGGSLTRFTSNPASRQSSTELLFAGMSRNENNNLNVLPSDLISDYRHWTSDHPVPSPSKQVGLASSWPSVAHRKTTNGSVSHKSHSKAPSTASTTTTAANCQNHLNLINKSIDSRIATDFTWTPTLTSPPQTSSVICPHAHQIPHAPLLNNAPSDLESEGIPNGSERISQQVLTSAPLLEGDNSDGIASRCLSVSSSVSGQEETNSSRPQ